MNAPDAAARFGSGRAVPRIEDQALLEGRGRFTDNVAVPGDAVIAFLRSPYAHARIVGIDVDAARAMPGVLGVFTGADLEAAGVKGMPTTPGLPARRRPQHRRPPLRRGLAHEFARYVGEAVAAVVAESREQARDAIEAIVLDLEELPAVTDARAARQRAPPSSSPRRRTTSPPRCAMATRPRPRRRSPAPRIGSRSTSTTSASRRRRWSRARSSPASTKRAAGSRCASATRCRPPWPAASPATLPDLTQPQVHVLVGDVGGGFGMKTGAVSGRPGRRLRGAGAEAPGALAGRAQRGVPLGVPRPRRRQPRRARARRRRPGAGAAREVARQRRRLRDAGRRRDPAADRPVGLDQHLRPADDRPALHRRAHPHRADRPVPRRRAARGDLPDRAADGRGGARDEDGSGGAAPPQHDPPRADALQERDGPDLRQRLVREDPRPGPGARRLERLRRAPRGVEEARQAARPRHRHLPRVDQRHWPSRRRSRSTSRPTASSRSTRRRSRWARASRPAMRSSRSTCSACRSRRCASSRATPIAATASAAPARARSSPAARR